MSVVVSLARLDRSISFVPAPTTWNVVLEASPLAGAFGDRFDTAVVEEAAAVEDDRGDASRFRSLGDHLADRLGAFALLVASVAGRVSITSCSRSTGCDQRLARDRRRSPGIDVRGLDRNTFSRGRSLRARDLGAHANVPSLARAQCLCGT